MPVSAAEYEPQKFVVVLLATTSVAELAEIVRQSDATSPATLRTSLGAVLPSQAPGVGRAIVGYRGAQPPVVASLDARGAVVRAPSNARFHTHGEARAEVAKALWGDAGAAPLAAGGPR